VSSRILIIDDNTSLGQNLREVLEGTPELDVDVRLAPDGSAWASFLDLCTKACVADASKGNDATEGVAVHLQGWPPRSG